MFFILISLHKFYHTYSIYLPIYTYLSAVIPSDQCTERDDKMFVINDEWIHIRAGFRLDFFFSEDKYISFVIINECRNMKLNLTKQQSVEPSFSELTFLLAQTSNFAYTHAKTDVECLENQYVLSSGAATRTAENLSKARPQ